MGLRYRKSVKLGKGVKLNIGKKSAGISIGGKHGGVSINSRTGATGRVSAPGTGLSYTQKIGGIKSSEKQYDSSSGSGPLFSSERVSDHEERISPSPLVRSESWLNQAENSLRFIPLLLCVLLVLLAFICIIKPWIFLVAIALVFLFDFCRKSMVESLEAAGREAAWGKPYPKRITVLICLGLCAVGALMGFMA